MKTVYQRSINYGDLSETFDTMPFQEGLVLEEIQMLQSQGVPLKFIIVEEDEILAKLVTLEVPIQIVSLLQKGYINRSQFLKDLLANHIDTGSCKKYGNDVGFLTLSIFAKSKSCALDCIGDIDSMVYTYHTYLVKGEILKRVQSKEILDHLIFPNCLSHKITNFIIDILFSSFVILWFASISSALSNLIVSFVLEHIYHITSTQGVENVISIICILIPTIVYFFIHCRTLHSLFEGRYITTHETTAGYMRYKLKSSTHLTMTDKEILVSLGQLPDNQPIIYTEQGGTILSFLAYNYLTSDVWYNLRFLEYKGLFRYNLNWTAYSTEPTSFVLLQDIILPEVNSYVYLLIMKRYLKKHHIINHKHNNTLHFMLFTDTIDDSNARTTLYEEGFTIFSFPSCLFL